MKLISSRRRLYSREIELEHTASHTAINATSGNITRHIDFAYTDEEGNYQEVRIQLETMKEAQRLLDIVQDMVNEWAWIKDQRSHE